MSLEKAAALSLVSHSLSLLRTRSGTRGTEGLTVQWLSYFRRGQAPAAETLWPYCCTDIQLCGRCWDHHGKQNGMADFPI